MNIKRNSKNFNSSNCVLVSPCSKWIQTSNKAIQTSNTKLKYIGEAPRVSFNQNLETKVNTELNIELN